MPKLAGLLSRVQARLAEVRAARAAEAAGGADQMASKTALLYNPPTKPQRPFEADYPDGNSDLSPAAGGSLLRRDMDGRPLTAGTVVGRTMVGGGDMPLPQGQIDQLAESLVGSRPQAVSQRELRGDSGRLTRSVDPVTGEIANTLTVNQNLSPELQQRVTAHELGHYIDDTAGQIETAGLSRELADVYNTLNTGRERATHRFGPQNAGYPKDEQPRELMAEAIRAYLADPNYLKTVAPQTAAAIRAAVNPNPRLRDIIQFNTVAPAAIGLSALAIPGDTEAGPRDVGGYEPEEFPRLEVLADHLDRVRLPIPLMEQPLNPLAELLRNVGRERPIQNRLLEIANIVL